MEEMELAQRWLDNSGLGRCLQCQRVTRSLAPPKGLFLPVSLKWNHKACMSGLLHWLSQITASHRLDLNLKPQTRENGANLLNPKLNPRINFLLLFCT